MQFACDYCGTRYKANIADARVLGSRLVFTCKKCARDVVVIGGAGENVPVAGSLLPDQGDGLVDGLIPPDPGKEAGPEPATGASDIVARGDVLEVSEDTLAGALTKGAAAAGGEPAGIPATPEAPIPATGLPPSGPGPFSVPRKKGASWVALGLGIAAVLAVAFFLFVIPATSRAKPEVSQPPTGISVQPAGESVARAAAAPASPEPPVAAVPTPTAAEPEPAPEKAPVVQIRELQAPEKKPAPTRTATPRAPAVRDAESVIEAGAIQEAFIRVRPACKLCAVTELKRDPGVRLGTVTATLTISPSGAVTKVDLGRADLASSPLGECVRQQLAKMTFASFDGAPVVLRRAVNLEVPGSR